MKSTSDLLGIETLESSFTPSFSYIPHPVCQQAVFSVPSKYIQKPTIYNYHFTLPDTINSYFSLYSCNSSFITLHACAFAPLQTILNMAAAWNS